MSDALAISNAVLWVMVVALALVVLALARQVGLLHARLGPVGALALAGGPQPGAAAPVLEVEDFAGRPLTIGAADAAGRSTLLVFVAPSCPICRTLLPALRSLAKRERGLRVVLASDGPREEHEGFVREHALTELGYVLSQALGLAYRVPRLPWAVLVDARGVLRSQGLVNSREHLESLLEAETLGVASLQEHLSKRAQGGGAG
jgi:methylamine dehydrogenase accessory protein MauD